MAGRPIDRILNVGVSAAAVPVLFGALQKILHAPSADMWLKIGLLTECAIFAAYALLYAIAPPPEAEINVKAEGAASGPSPLKTMDAMMAEADITPANLKKLGEGFNKLGSTVAGISDVSDVVKSTSDFGSKAKAAGSAVDAMAAAFTNSAKDMNTINLKMGEASKTLLASADDAVKAKDQIAALAGNLTKLNGVYANMLSAMQGR
jgi:hypothetical protein